MRAAAAALLVALAASACSSGSGSGDDDGASLGDTVAPTAVTAPEVPPPSPPGTGVVQVGATVGSFAVIECQLTPGDDPASPTILSVQGQGTTATGIPFEVEVQRAATSISVETFTDTVTYSDTARILQVQRFEVSGDVTDLRDPDARGTLLRVRPDGVSTRGLAGPPGSEGGDDGIVGLALDATCPEA